ncbi:MAG: S-layer homology domain-containing protein, partial [Butyricicoccus sp.]|nr:S-layer homology domain-containing protein [Butyricicoccus sp.]
VIPAIWSAAGAFSEERALVRDILGDVHVIGTDGDELASLPGGATPVYLDIFCDDVIVLEAGGKQCLYSLGQMGFLTYYIYDEIQPFDRDCAIMRQGTLYGLLSAGGAENLPATYPYLNELGEGVYTARGLSMGADLIDERGQKVYALDTYVGGLNDLHCGMTWYGTMSGDVAFLNATGTFVKVVSGVETPVILTSNVARVKVENETRWIDMLTGEMLYSSARRYTLSNGARVSTAYYEKYLGMRPDGSEYGWSVEYPLLTGLSDLSVQQKINDGLRDFFVGGPYHSMLQNCGLTATYGYTEQDGLLIVWAIGTYETSDTAVIWNESVMFDLATGARYTVEENLFRAGASSTLMSMLPAGSPYYGNARVSGEGVCFYRNYPVSIGAKPYAESIWFGYEDLVSVLDYASPLCRKLTGIEALSYTDVPQTYWGYRVISTCTARGLMVGDDGKFFPMRTISLSEVAAVLARVLELPAGSMPGINPNAWYANELGAAYEAGLLEGLSQKAQEPTGLITRADMMQMLANTIEQRGTRTLTNSAAQDVLAGFADVDDVPADRVQAAATCVQAGVIVGDGTSLRPNDTLTRAEFAAILAALVA